MASTELEPVGFGDAEPEDAWDVGDPLVDKLLNLRERLDLFDADPYSARAAQRLAQTRQDFDALPKIMSRGKADHVLYDTVKKRLERAER